MQESGTIEYATQSAPRLPRWRAGLIIILAMWAVIKIPEWVAPPSGVRLMGMIWGPIVGTVLSLIWLLFFSRLPWSTRLSAFVAFVVGAAIALVLGHPTMRGMGIIVLAMPITISILVLWIVLASGQNPRLVRSGAVLIALLGWSFFTMRRMDGLTGDIHPAFSWRWSSTAEDRYLASLSKSKTSSPTTFSASAIVLSDGDWPAFRGVHRDGKVTGATLRTDWAVRPPKLMWKHGIGPGWSSLCVVGDRLFTLEQRNESEVTVCMNADTGEVLWSHADQTRFSESMGGDGPRSTPTFADGKLYVLGASGKLNCLDPSNGSVIWSRDLVADTGAALPMFGFSSSPLIQKGLVTVLTGAAGKAIATYDAATGKPAWSTGDGWSYASPQLTTIDGVEQILYINQSGLSGLDPASGQTFWHHDFPLPGNANRVTQPTAINEHDFLLGASFGAGTRRINVTHDGSAWKTTSPWYSKSFNPYYNDAVYHKGFCYGFDNSVFACMDIETGKSKWRSHGYGNGQVLLLVDQDLLLILTEKGEVVLLDAKPDSQHEIGRFQAIEGKSWNHPVVAHGKLFVRNSEEVAAFEMQ